jgi:molybdopterin synthase catalytic subunit/molybdopterin synthase sulfur carrier subunit
MKVRVKLFAAAKEVAGCDELAIDLPPGAKVADLRAAVVDLMPGLQAIVRHSMWAVGSEYVRDDTKLSEQSDVALIPPVSGG